MHLAVCIVGALPSCFDLSLLMLCCFGVLLCFCFMCCFESAVVWCAGVLWVSAGRLEVSSHEVVRASVDESVVSGMCVVRCCVLVMLTVWRSHALMLCAVG